MAEPLSIGVTEDTQTIAPGSVVPVSVEVSSNGVPDVVGSPSLIINASGDASSKGFADDEVFDVETVDTVIESSCSTGELEKESIAAVTFSEMNRCSNDPVSVNSSCPDGVLTDLLIN